MNGLPICHTIRVNETTWVEFYNQTNSYLTAIPNIVFPSTEDVPKYITLQKEVCLCGHRFNRDVMLKLRSDLARTPNPTKDRLRDILIDAVGLMDYSTDDDSD